MSASTFLAHASSIAVQALAAESKGRMALRQLRAEDADELFIEAAELTQQLGTEFGRLGLDMPEAFEASRTLTDLFQDAAIRAWDAATLARYAA